MSILQAEYYENGIIKFNFEKSRNKCYMLLCHMAGACAVGFVSDNGIDRHYPDSC